MASGVKINTFIGDLGILDTLNLTGAQKMLLRMAARAYPQLIVSAPTFEYSPFPIPHQVQAHHAGTAALDFAGVSQRLLYDAFHYFAKFLQGGVGLGISAPEAGFTAENHLHLDLMPRSARWIEIDKTPTTLTTVDSLDNLSVLSLSGGPEGYYPLSSKKVPGIYSQYLRKLSALYGPPMAPEGEGPPWILLGALAVAGYFWLSAGSRTVRAVKAVAKRPNRKGPPQGAPSVVQI